MATEISYQTWSGGSGWGDPMCLIGYCKESPEEVLKYVMYSYDVYQYKGLYRPIDDRYPNNVSGLSITEFNRDDVIVIKSIKDMKSKLKCAISKSQRSKDTIMKSFELCRKWHTYDNKKVQAKYDILLKELEDIINKL